MITFGQPGSITPHSFTPDLPTVMIIEGLTLLREMGMTQNEIAKASGMSVYKVRSYFNTICRTWSIDQCWGMRGREETGGAQ
ncbi:hypothetical protein BG46_10885 [Brucella anthropi]|uniref:helix-turn-helix domain-containing protein n=1 Tax=Brucella anthropi TaxID=529 RepID=UPI00044AB699|nr:helix-turn-helix transcriptional regulator [Brucella anthropi]EXL07808.1 hypothetical protein BG46_10885 [Brucella anthropi]RRY13353.1 XRE family transcriptional regulator [Brucella anthropi]